MGPHPETPVDVQKYIGSCLITQQPRTKRKSCPRGGHLHPKDGRCNPGYVQNCTKASLAGGFNNMTNYAWTGVPLISVARQSKSHHLGKNRAPSRNSGKQPQDYMNRVESPIDTNNLEDILPISRLAIHAQGAPLILSPKDSEKMAGEMEGYSYKGHDFYLGDGGSGSRLYMLMPGCSEDVQHHQSMRGERTSSGSSCYLEDDSEISNSRAVASSPSQSDCISTTSEDSGTSENGLPRIIKPRKRRKKDRRLSESEGSSETPQGTIVTLKPYQPLCYRYSGNGSNNNNGSSNNGNFGKYFSKPLKTSSCSVVCADAEDESGFRKGAYPYPPSPRCRCSYCVPPPSTLLTPPDSPVAEDSLLAIATRNGGKFLSLSGGDCSATLDESVMKSQNALIRKYYYTVICILIFG